ncbi:MAG: glycosyltransferase [Candidatus Falkowbacteria bacterium]|nr:glycosyltransferase [Candidatus Falkowbacteria bacterium]
MVNRLLIVSTSSSKQILLGDLLSHFKATRQPFFLLTKSRRLLHRGKNEHWDIKSSSLPSVSPLIFVILSPLIWLFFGLSFMVSLWRWRPNTVILAHWPEKIIFSPLVSLFGKRLIWLEYPEKDLSKMSPFIKFFYKRFSKNVSFVVFGNKSSEILRKIVGDKDISVFLPTAASAHLQQHSIFKTLAEQTNRGRFVIGSVLYGLPRDQAERLLSALSIAQTVCPNIELVIIGEGKNRRQIQWLARRMNLERRVWLAGPTVDFQRWVGQLDVYVIANKRPSLEDASWAISAMASNLPVIAPQQAWLEDVVNSKTGIMTDIDDPETLARQFINLQQETELCQQIGKEARLMSQKLTFENFVDSFTKLLS